MNIYIDNKLQQEMIQHARNQHPFECCGILLGQQSDHQATINRIIKATNIATGDQKQNYQIDWRTLFDTVRATRIESDRIIGFYHSHPDGSTQPSRLDMDSAWVDHSYIIISTHSGDKYTMSSWRIHHENDTFEREPLTCKAIEKHLTELSRIH